MTTGVHHDMPSADYFAVPGLSASGLKLLSRSAAHYYAAVLDPNRPPREQTPPMRAGTLAHCALLEPEALQQRYVIRPAGLDGRTKEGRAWLAETAQQGLEIITADELTTAHRQAHAVRALPEVAALMDNCTTEVSAFARDDETGVLLKARPDCLAPAGEGYIVLDLKTTRSAGAEEFQRSVVSYSYALQSVHYTEVVEKATGKEVVGFVFACVESDYPHCAAAYLLSDEWLAMARQKRRRLIGIYAECLATDVWPGYEQAIQQLECPAWVKQ